MLGGASYQYLSRFGMFEVSAGTDIGSRHNGLYAQTSYSYPIRGQRWGITPNIGYAYNSEKLNQHLYGVSAAEAAERDLMSFSLGGMVTSLLVHRDITVSPAVFA
ncbi:MltA-interacting protein precursor [Vibrio astriarenae]|nr:MltA-interacting protein precursor [Vibrio sp. C7]